jgi:hydroxymethylpyrimidine/phosphomethylpyrimidine kinase
MKRPCVLVFAGLDPSGGAGVQADIEAIAAMGSHALTVVTTLTVQDNDHVTAVHAVDTSILREQVRVLCEKFQIAAIKIGITGSQDNVTVITETIKHLRQQRPELPVVLDPVLASGHGDALSREDAVSMIGPLQSLATLITPNLPEAIRLCDGETSLSAQASKLLRTTPHVLIKGGHGEGDEIVNTWFSASNEQSWHWPRLAGGFHGSGCTLASAIAACLAAGLDMQQALSTSQRWVQTSLSNAYSIADGQRIPARTVSQVSEVS